MTNNIVHFIVEGGVTAKTTNVCDASVANTALLL